MKLEFDTTDTRQVRAAYELVRALMGLHPSEMPAGAKADPSPPKAAAATTAQTTPSTPATSAAVTPAATPSAAPATASAPASETASAVDLPTAQKAFQEFVRDTKSPARAKAILAEFGQTTLAALPTDSLGAFVARLVSARAEG